MEQYAARTGVGQHGGPSKDHNLHPNHRTDHWKHKHNYARTQKLNSWCFEPSQLHKVISGLIERRRTETSLPLFMSLTQSPGWSATNVNRSGNDVTSSKRHRIHTLGWPLMRCQNLDSPLPLSGETRQMEKKGEKMSVDRAVQRALSAVKTGYTRHPSLF